MLNADSQVRSHSAATKYTITTQRVQNGQAGRSGTGFYTAFFYRGTYFVTRNPSSQENRPARISPSSGLTALSRACRAVARPPRGIRSSWCSGAASQFWAGVAGKRMDAGDESSVSPTSGPRTKCLSRLWAGAFLRQILASKDAAKLSWAPLERQETAPDSGGSQSTRGRFHRRYPRNSALCPSQRRPGRPSFF